MDEPIFYIARFVHLISLVVGFGAVIVVDTFGLLFVLEKRELKEVALVAKVTQRLIWLGFFGLIVSGAVLLYIKGTVSDLTKIKLFLVLLLGLNGIFLHTIKKGLEQLGAAGPFPANYKFKLALAFFISQIGWWGTIIIGYLNTHVL